MRGKKYNDDVKEKALALLAINNNITDVAAQLGVPRSTVSTWKEAYEKEAAQGESENITALRQKKKEEFIVSAWQSIEQSMKLIDRRLQRAIDNEDKIDELIDSVREGDLSDKDIKSIASQLAELKVDNVRDLVNIISVLYDKAALAAKEATAIIDGGITLHRFEEL